jgi:hypothetical protein
MSLWDELLSAPHGEPTLLEPYSPRWETYRAYAISRGATNIAHFMDVQARRRIPWHVQGPLPADHGLVHRIKMREQQKKLGLRIVDNDRTNSSERVQEDPTDG